jgi:protein phosphatase
MATSNHDKDAAHPISHERFTEKFFASSPHRMQLEFGAATHKGYVRAINEDHYVIVRRRRTNEIVRTNLPPDNLALSDDTAFGMIVADGMGGANFGEFASRLALQRMFELAQQATSWVMKYTDLDVQQIRLRVQAYVGEIQATLREYTDADPALAGMGTTWTSAHLLLPHVLVVHVGDSRAYLMHRGELHQITRDETVAQAYVDAGMDPSTVNKFRHLLLNSLGGDSDDVTAQIHQLEIEPGDKLLLCTDGLSGMVPDDQIASILQQSGTPQSACDMLISAALNSGGKDNVTAVLAAASGDST